MAQMSKNFNMKEFKCKCGCTMPKAVRSNIQDLVAFVLQPVRDFLGVPIRITSGYRCAAYNRSVGGVKNSQHILGKAADFIIHGLLPRVVYKIITLFMKNTCSLGPGGVGNYYRFTHADIRKTSRAIRWAE